MKVAVYTCITGGYDIVKVPGSGLAGLSFFCFTDNPEMVMPPWVPLPIDLPTLNLKDKSRYVKMHPHVVLPGFDATLYIDGSIQILDDVSTLIYEALQGDGDIFIYEHPERDCIYREAVTCSYFGHDWIWNISSQMRRYHRDGFPSESGLFEAFVIIRKNNPKVNELMECWWGEYIGGVSRDQLSLPYVSWRKNVPINSLGKNDPRLTQRYFRFINHPSRTRLAVVFRECINRLIGFVFPGILFLK